jgi:hypothetical protein
MGQHTLKRETSFANMRYNALQTKERIICRWQFTNLQVPLEELSIHIFLSRGDTGHVISKLHSSFASLFPSLPPSRDARGVMEGTTHQMHLLEEQMDFPSNHHIIMLSCRWKLSFSVIRHVALCASGRIPGILSSRAQRPDFTQFVNVL